MLLCEITGVYLGHSSQGYWGDLYRDYRRSVSTMDCGKHPKSALVAVTNVELVHDKQKTHGNSTLLHKTWEI